jgi:hypothetical protein
LRAESILRVGLTRVRPCRYHVALVHACPKSVLFGMFSKDTLQVFIDGEKCHEDVVPTPRPRSVLPTPSIGKNFDGQMSAVYIFREAMSQQVRLSVGLRDTWGGLVAERGNR